MPDSIAEMANVEVNYAVAMANHYKKQGDQRREVMAVVASLVSPRKLASIEQFIDYGNDLVCDFEITETHAGERQDEPGTAFRYIFLDQHSGGDPSGDDHYGWVWIPLPQSKYLKFHYA